MVGDLVSLCKDPNNRGFVDATRTWKQVVSCMDHADARLFASRAESIYGEGWKSSWWSVLVNGEWWDSVDVEVVSGDRQIKIGAIGGAEKDRQR